MECRWAGRNPRILFSISILFFCSCVFLGQDKPLSPRTLFSPAGSAFLENAQTLALKGRIEYEDARVRQEGSFKLFLTGPDSLSFLIEGPLHVDVFRMIILGEDVHLLSSEDEGWRILHKGERVAVAEYGVDNISPFLTGLFAFPQYFIRALDGETGPGEYGFSWDDEPFTCRAARKQMEFSISQKNSGIKAVYGGRKDFENGFYPSKIEITNAPGSWRITLNIDAVRVNPQIPQSVWLPE